MSSGSSGRIIANRPRVLPGIPYSAYSSDAGSHSPCNPRPTEALLAQFGNLIAPENDPRAADRLACSSAALPCALQTGPDSVRDSDPLLFGDPGSDGDHEFASRAGGAEVGLGE